ncbi:MAG: CotH kinase family protein [Oscillospiraceae bacterium]|nr:CotH kinase family protein [Oscillospiraceae bacterium]
MNIRKLFSLALALLTALTLLAGPAYAEEQKDAAGIADGLVFYGMPGNDGTAFRVTRSDAGGYVLFLPSGADAERVPFSFPFPDGSYITFDCGAERQTYDCDSAADIASLLNGSGPAELDITLRNGAGVILDSLTVTAAVSSSVDSLFLTSADPNAHGRSWTAASKSNVSSGSLLMLDENGAVTHGCAVDQIKGRGNSTWGFPKKPYQLKLAQKDDLLDTGDPENRAKKWILLANYADATLMANQIALELGAAIGMEYNIGYRPVDLYYDGEYAGSYLLTEKVEIGSGRVAIFDLEKENAAANAGADLSSLPTGTGVTENGARYSYCDGMNDPEDISGGYLLEMDYAERALEEVCWIETVHGTWVTVKSPEFASRAEMERIASLFQSFENAVYNNGTDPDTGKRYSDIVDVASIAQCYLVNELSRDIDGFASSAYLYLDRGAEKMKMGPLWDYDLGFRERSPGTPLYTVHGTFMNRIYRNRDFREAVSDIYRGTMYPFITEVLLSEGENDGVFDSFGGILGRIADSRTGDALIWGADHEGPGQDISTEQLRDFISKHAEIMRSAYEDWADRDDEYHVFTDVPADSWFAPEVWRAEDIGLVHGASLTMFSPFSRATRAQTVQILFNMDGPGDISPRPVFSDVAEDAWFAEAVTWAYDSGIARGAADNAFRPEAHISRQDIVVLLYRYYGEPEADVSVLEKFSDRGQISEYAADAMAWAVENGVIKGTSKTRLSPTDTANRAELTALLLRCYQITAESPLF